MRHSASMIQWVNAAFLMNKVIWLYLGIYLHLTHWGRYTTAAFSQMTFSSFLFLEWKPLNFKLNFTEICSLWSNWQHSSIGSDNGLAPNRRQTIMWSYVGMLYWRTYASLGPNELSSVFHNWNLLHAEVYWGNVNTQNCIFYYLYVFRCCRWLKYFLVQDKDPLILHRHHHTCRCSATI